MKRTTIGYAALLIAALSYAYSFYKMGIVARACDPPDVAYNDMLTDVKYFCALIVAPGLVIFFAIRKRPLFSLNYLLVVLGWTVSVSDLKPSPYHWDSLTTPLAGAWFGYFLITWPLFLLVAPVALILALEHWLDRRAERPSKPDAA